MSHAKGVASFAAKIYKQKLNHPGLFVNKLSAEHFFDNTIQILFPQLRENFRSYENPQDLCYDLNKTQQELNCLLRGLEQAPREDISAITEEFFGYLSEVNDNLEQDIDFMYECDPSCKSRDDIIICNPGFYAISAYRIANFFYQKKIPIFARLISEYAHWKTGVDINPGATIAAPFNLVHGAGVVIGETTHIGKRVKIYQGVTLGATSVSKDLETQKRHPTIEDDVEIGENAIILGAKTVIGKGSIISENVWITKSVPAYTAITEIQKVEHNHSIMRNAASNVCLV